MVPISPENLINGVWEKYLIEVPFQTALNYLEMDPYATPDSLYLYIKSLEEAPHTSIRLRGYKFVDFEKDKISSYPGVYIWILKDNAVIPSIDGFSPQFSFVEVKGHEYRVLYVGKAKSESLYDRIMKNHLRGNPRQSTLCWSIAAIMGMPYTITDKHKPKLDKDHCQEIKKWLLENCYLLYQIVKDIDSIDFEENEQIYTLMPPLNLDKNPLKDADPFIQSVSKYRHIGGGYTRSSSNTSGFTKKYLCIFIFLAILVVLGLAAL